MKLSKAISIKDVIGTVFTFDELSLLHDFCKTEAKFWKTQCDKFLAEGLTPPDSFTKYQIFEEAVPTLKTWKTIAATWDGQTFHSQLDNFYNNFFRRASGVWLWSGHPLTHKWIELQAKHTEIAAAFLKSFQDGGTTSGQKFENFMGDVLAYEFRMQAESSLPHRRVAERKSLESIRKDMLSKKDELIVSFDELQHSMSLWKGAKQKEITDWQAERVNHADDSATYQSKAFHERLATWTKRVESLEITYREKLRLESPASYWKKSADKFRQQGFYWSITFILVVLLTMTYLGYFFMAWSTGNSLPIKLSTLEGVIIFAAFLSLTAVVVRVLGKMIFSSFHLQRDSEEREQLTHLYLSLLKDAAIDEDSRKIVLQSLFSRSETGLLAGDSGPTMPGNVLESILQASKRSGVT